MCFDADAQASKVVSKAASKLFKSTGSKVAVGAAGIKAIENLAGKSLSRNSDTVSEALKQFYFRLNLPDLRNKG